MKVISGDGDGDRGRTYRVWWSPFRGSTQGLARGSLLLLQLGKCQIDITVVD